MKKKLIQFLMLPIIAVSIGAFVSCKDTNEDVISELRQELDLDNPDGSLADRLAALQAELDALKGKTGNCNCTDYSGDITTLKGDVATLLAQLAALQKSLTVNPDGTVDIGGSTVGGGGSSGAGGFTLDDLLGDLTDIIGDDGFTTSLMELIKNNTNLITQNTTYITEIQNLLKQYGPDIEKLLAAQETAEGKFKEIDDDLAKLQEALDAIKQCDCKAEFEKVWAAITTLETGLEQATDKANSAFDLAKQIEQDYKTADEAVKKIAEDAAALAENALKAAENAQAAADKAQEAAQNAQTDADKAQAAAKKAQETADLAVANAANAAELAQKALALESRIIANEEAIKALQSQVNTNKQDIETLNGHITRIDGVTDNLKKLIDDNADQIGKNTIAIGQNADNIKQNTLDITEIKERLDNIDKDLVEIKKYADDIEKNAKAIADLKSTVETLDQTLNEKITGVSEKANEAFQKASEAAAAAATNAAYIENLEKRVKANEDAIAALQLANEQLNKTVGDLDTAVKQNASDIKSLQDNVETIQNNVTTMANDIKTMKTDIKDLQDRVKAVEDELVQVKDDCAKNLQEAKNYTDTEIAAAKVAIMAAVMDELKKYYTQEQIDQMLKDVDDNIQKLKVELMDDYTLKITTLEQTLTVRLDNLEETVGNLGTTVGDHEGRIKTLEDLVKEITSCTCDEEAMQKSIELLKTMLNNIRDDIEANDELYKQLIQGNTDAIDAINEKIEGELKKRIEELATSVDGLTTNFNKLKDIIYNNYATKAYVEEITNAIIEDIEDVKENVQNNTDRIDELAEQLAEYAGLEARVAALESIAIAFEDKFDEIDEQLGDKVDIEDYEEDISNIMDLIQANATDISDLQDAVEGINEDIATLKEEQNKLKDRMHTAEEALKALEDKIDTEINEVKEKIAEIQNNLAKQVTSINLQAATNPWFGMISTPFGTQSNFVIALYGTNKDEVVFPAIQGKGGNYVRPTESLTAKDMQMIGNVSETFDAGWPIMFKYDKDEDYAYAGKIYMTINPNTANLDGLKMSIVNTADEESPITLSPITKSEEKLQFGWTRADNGFYEAEAIVDGLGVEKINSPKFNTAAMKDAAENVRGMIEQIAKTSSIDGNGNRFEKLASDINNIVRDLKFDRSGLKVTYTTEETDANGIKQEKEHSVYSEYNLAATAFKPLGLETLKDLNVQTIPGYEKVEALINRVANKVNNKIKVFFKDFNGTGLVEKLANFTINDIDFGFDEAKEQGKFIIHINQKITLEGCTFHLYKMVNVKNVPIKFSKTLTIDVNGIEATLNYKSAPGDITIDMSQITVDYPTVVIQNDEDGDGKNLETVLIVPIYANENPEPGEEPIGYAQVPLDGLLVEVPDGETVKINGSPVIDFNINKNIDLTGQISYDLDINETFDTSFLIDEWINYGDDGGTTKAFDIKFDQDISEIVEDILGMVEGPVMDKLDQVQDLINEANKLIAQINSYDAQFTNTVNSVRDRLIGYLQKINGAITSVINSANSRLQPFMVANSKKKGMKRLSGAKNYPTRMSSDMSLYATSQTMELFVPFARKHVAVTNVFSADLSKNVQDGTLDKSILTAVKGDNLNKVLNGTECEIKLSGMKSDYVYEIAYSALDFHGKMATRKYYITLE